MLSEKESDLIAPISNYFYLENYDIQRKELEFFEYHIDFYCTSLESKQTVAVELKLHNWKKAVEQALIYQLCSDYSYIAMPLTTKGAIDLKVLKRYGLGLIIVENNHLCNLIIKPKRSDVLIKKYKNHFLDLLMRGRNES